MSNSYATRRPTRRATGTLLGTGLCLLLGTTAQAQTLPQYPLAFNGTSQYVAVPNRSALELSTATIEMWVKPNWSPGSHSNANPCLVGKRTANNTRFSLHMGNALTSIGIWNGTNYFTRPFNFTKGQWYHIAYVMTSANTEIFVNGVSIGSTGNGINTSVTGADLCFGAANSGSAAELFEGEMDEIRVWNTTRTQAQISANMNASIGATTAGLLDYYPIDFDVLSSGNAAARTLKDYTSSYHGTLNNYTYEAAPTITAFAPLRNAVSAVRATNVGVSFSQNMGSAAASDAALKVFGSLTGKLAGTFSGSGTNTIQFDPTQNLKPGETASVTVTTAAQTVGGSALAKPQVMQFIGKAEGTGRGGFATSQTIALSGNPAQLVTADIDGDGDLDLLVPNGGSSINVRLNNGSAAFSAPSVAANATVNVGSARAQGLTMADIDSDGDLDMLVADNAYSSAGSVRVRLNNGQGAFSAPATGSQITVGQGPQAIAAADIDGDGDQDMLVANFNGSTVSVRFNDGSGVFTAPSSNGEVSVLSGPLHLAVADIDSDGDVDLLTASYEAPGKVGIRLNNGSGVFTTPGSGAEVSVPDQPYRVAMGDVNGDGKPDMLVSNVSTATVSLRLNNGSGVFTTPATASVAEISIADPAQQLALADVDADGDLDLLATVYSGGSVSVRLNNGSGVFTAPATNAQVGAGGSALLATGDLDGDGDIDLVASNNLSNSPTQVLLNQSTPTITNLSLTSGTVGTSVVLTGTNFIGATSVKFNGTTASSFIVNSATQLTATVPTGATTGTVTVTTASGTATSTQTFTVITDLMVTGNTTIAAGTYRNITVTSTGSAVLSAGVAVSGAFVVQSGGSLYNQCEVLAGTGSFALAAGATLTICHPDGITASGATGAIQVAGSRQFSPAATYNYVETSNQTGTGLPATVRNLTVVRTNLTLTQPVAIRRLLSFYLGGIQNGGNLTLRSDADSTAQVQVQAGLGTVVGAATVQRYISPGPNTGLGYRHLAAPVTNTTVADLATGSFTPVVNDGYNTSATPNAVTPFPTVFGYDETRQASSPATTYSAFDKGWASPAALNDALVPGKGYTVSLAPSQTLDFVGTLGTGDVTLNLTRGAGPSAGWNLIGNPYPSTLDWSQVTLPQELDGSMYVYQSTSRYAGTYRSYTNGVGGNPTIALGQAFFVRVSDGQSAAQLTLTNSARTTDFSAAGTFQRATADARPRLQLLVQPATGTLQDALHVYFEAGATAGPDARYDAIKLANPSGLSLAALASGQALAINGLPVLGTSAVLVPLQLAVPQAGSYALQVGELLNFAAGTTVYLRDNELNTTTLLSSSTRYAFTLSGTTAPGRFALEFRPGAVLATATQALAQQLQVFPNPAQGRFALQLPAGTGAATLTLHNALGQVVHTQAVQGDHATVEVPGLAGGVYVLRVQTALTTLSQHVVLD